MTKSMYDGDGKKTQGTTKDENDRSRPNEECHAHPWMELIQRWPVTKNARLYSR